MLGSRAEAEDVVQEAYVRWHQADREAIRTPEGWLVTTATRLAIDRLRELKTERETYSGPWLPEPLMSNAPPPPDRNVDLASDLSVAFLVLLERLAPDERAAFLLHDVFETGYGDIAALLGKSEAACRQIVHRARERVRQDHKRFQVTETARVGLLKRFVAAVEARDEQAIWASSPPTPPGPRMAADARPRRLGPSSVPSRSRSSSSACRSASIATRRRCTWLRSTGRRDSLSGSTVTSLRRFQLRPMGIGSLPPTRS